MIAAAVSAVLCVSLVLPFAGCDSKEQEKSASVISQSSDSDDILETAARQMLRTNVTSNENGKEETVYVITDGDGKSDQVIVTAHVKNGDGVDALQDVTNLTNIENTKGDETYTENADGSITWDAHGNDIFYRGESDAELPLDVKVTYTLDGKEVSAEELAGASGHLVVEFTYENHETKTVDIDGEETEIVKPAIVASGMLLDLEHAQNVKVTNGKLIDDGNRTAVVGLALPGLAEDLIATEGNAKDDSDLSELTDQIQKLIPESVRVEADVTDFSMSGTISVASYDLSSVLDEDADTESLGEKAEDLKKDAKDLEDGMTALKDGSKELSEYLDELHSGSSELNDGVKQLSDGAKSLDDGAQRLSDGVKTLDAGAVSLADGAGQVDAGAARLQDGTKTLDAGVSSVDNGAQQINTHMNELSSGTATLNAYLEQLKSGAYALTNGTTQLSEGAGNLSAGAQRLSGGLTQLSTSVSAVVQAGKNLIAALISGDASDPDQYGIYEAVQAIVSRAGQLRDILQSVMNGAEIISEKCREIAADAKSGNPEEFGIYEAASALQAGLESVVGGLQEKLAQAGSALNAINENDTAALGQLQNLTGSLQGVQSLVAEMAANGEIPAEAAQKISSALGGVVPEETITQIIGEVGANTALTQQVQSALAETQFDTSQLEAAASVIRNDAARIFDCAQQLAAIVKSGTGAETDGSGIYEAAAAAFAEIKQLTDIASKVCGLIESLISEENIGTLLAGLERLDALGSQLTSVLGQLSDGANALYDGSVALADGASRADAGAKSLADGVGQIADGGKALSDGAAQLAAGTGALAEGTGKLAQGTHELAQGADTLKDGTGRLADGAQQLASGTKTLSDGADALKNGTSELVNGTEKLADGSSKLEDGAAQLADGSKTLAEGIEKLDKEAISKIAKLIGTDLQSIYERLQILLDYAKEPESFSGCADGIDSSVQYVFKTGEVG